MAKKTASSAPPEKKEKYPYPSYFGSHSMMVDGPKTGELGDPLLAVLKDENGFYTTERIRIDSGLADPNRYVSSRLRNLT